MAELTTCPFCKGEIDADALKCRHCGEWVRDRPTIVAAPDLATPTPGRAGQGSVEERQPARTTAAKRFSRGFIVAVGLLALVGFLLAQVVIAERRKADAADKAAQPVREFQAQLDQLRASEPAVGVNVQKPPTSPQPKPGASTPAVSNEEVNAWWERSHRDDPAGWIQIDKPLPGDQRNGLQQGWTAGPLDSKLTDFKGWHADVWAMAPEHTTIGAREVWPVLSFRCDNRKTQAAMMWDIFMHTEGLSVRYRVDAAPAKMGYWSTSSDYQWIFIQSGNAIAFIKSLLGHERLTFNVTPYSEHTMEVEFDLRGLEEKIKPVRKACGW